MKKSKNIILVILIFVSVIILWSATWYVSTISIEKWQDRGTFGDMFGSINALFSGLAFAGVIIALYMQKKELSLQRTELEQTRGELKGQKEQLELQNQNLTKQNFENTYFHLINLHHEYISKVYVPGFGVNNQGRNSFVQFINKYREILTSNVNINRLENEIDKIKAANIQFKKDFPGYLEIYFQNICNILKFILQSNIDKKEFYSELFVSQLSIHELRLINYFSIDSEIDKSFTSILNKFSVLERLPKKEMLIVSHNSDG